MQAVAASVILEDAYHFIGWDASQLEDREKQQARMAFSRALQELWDAWWWEELMLCAKTALATPWFQPSGPGGFNFWLGDQPAYDDRAEAYYLAAGNGFGNNEQPTLADGSTNVANNWARWVEDNRPAKWSATADYFTLDGGFAGVNGEVVQVEWRGAIYQANGSQFNATRIHEEPGTPIPDGETRPVWYAVPTWQPVIPVTTLSQNEDNSWNEDLTGPFGPVRMVSRFDPRTSANPQPYVTVPTADGVRVLGLAVGKGGAVCSNSQSASYPGAAPDSARPWVWSRRVTPIITGDDFDAAATYEATPASELVFPD